MNDIIIVAVGIAVGYTLGGIIIIVYEYYKRNRE